ncbi:hypothetical protein B0H11DRAFT_2116264 [Mycena galericulata]|nr:hypothetical protein B0H11DRAFT_2116264 [Mycena galericulata]
MHKLRLPSFLHSFLLSIPLPAFGPTPAPPFASCLSISLTRCPSLISHCPHMHPVFSSSLPLPLSFSPSLLALAHPLPSPQAPPSPTQAGRPRT